MCAKLVMQARLWHPKLELSVTPNKNETLEFIFLNKNDIPIRLMSLGISD